MVLKTHLKMILWVCPKVAQFIKIRMPLWDKPIKTKKD